MRARTVRFTAAVQSLLLIATLLLPALAAATEIHTDLWIYQDGDTVTVTGIDFGPTEAVDFVTKDPDGTVIDTGSATTDETGSVVYAFVLHATSPGIYTVVATGTISGLTASTEFDPASASITGANPSAATRAWFRTVGTGFDVTITGQTSCNGAGCTSPTNVTVDIFPSDGGAGSVAGVAVAAKVITPISNGNNQNWTTGALQFRTSPSGTQFAIPADGLYDVRARFFFTGGDPSPFVVVSDNHLGVDNTAPALLAGGQSTNPTSSTALSFTIADTAGGSGVLCSTITAADFTLSNANFGSVTGAVGSNLCTVNLTSTIGAGASGTSTVSMSGGFAVTDIPGNATTNLTGLPLGWTVDRQGPTLTGGNQSTTPTTSTALSFTLTGNEAINCATVSAADFNLTAATFTASTQSTASQCTIALASTIAAGAAGTSSVALAGGFSVQDALGNAATTASGFPMSWTVDRQGPSVTINQKSSPPVQADPTNISPINFTVVFSESVADFATGDVTLSGSAGATTAVVTGSGTTYNVAVSGMTGSGTVIATLLAGVASDALGNGSAASTSTDNQVTYDVTAPTVPVVNDTNPATPANDNAVDVRGDTDGNVLVSVYTNASCTGSPAGTGSSNGGGSFSISITVADNSTTTFWATAADAIGNVSACSTTSITYVEDSIAPSVTINQGATQVDPASTSPIIFDVHFSEAVTGFANGDVTLSGTAGATTAVVSGGPQDFTVTVSGMTGNGTVIAAIAANRAMDAAGNNNTASTSTDNTVTYANDVIPPDTTITGMPSNPTASSAASFSFTGSDNVTPAGSLTFQCKLDGGSFTSCTSPQSYLGISDGSHTFQVRAIDGVGLVDPTPASFTWTVDTTAPNTTIDLGPASITANPQPTFAFSGSDGTGTGVAAFQCQIDAGGYAPCTSPFTTPVLTDGSHTFFVRAIDAVGNVDPTPASRTFLVDATAPDTNITSTPADPTASSSATFTFEGIDGGTGVSGFYCQLDGGGWDLCGSPKSYSLLGDGSHTFEVLAYDGAGNQDPTPASFSWVVDATAPETTIDVSPSDPSASAAASFEFSGSDGSGTGVAGFECKLDLGSFSACSSPQAYLGLGDGSHTFQVRAVDVVGNVDASPASFTWVIDTTMPVITATATKSDATSYVADTWTNLSVTVTFSCADPGGSGIAFDSTSSDGGTEDGDTATGSFSSLGSHCVDNAGNAATTVTVSPIKVDKTKPVITGDASPNANAFGWNNTDVTVSFECADALSGVDDDTVAGDTLTTEGTGQSVTNTGACTDNAGNVADSATVSGIDIDKTKPVISGDASPDPNTFGWNNTDVTVSFTCADALAGVDSNTVAGATVTTEGAGQSVTNTGTCTDKAGNTADPATVSGIDIDKTAPLISGDASPDPNTFGWNNTDVAVTFTCSDGLSGVDVNTVALDNELLTDETAGTTVSSDGDCTDEAGNTAATPVDVGPIRIDKTSPLITGGASPAANSFGWNNSPVSVAFSCAEQGLVQSGLDTNTVATDNQVLNTETSGTTVSSDGVCTDKAGNTAATPVDVGPIRIDMTAPVITGDASPDANGYGWNNTAVTVSFTCTDTGSVQSTIATDTVADDDATLGSEGANQSVSSDGDCVDKAGNAATTPVTVGPINIDLTAPVISGLASPGANPNGWNNTNVSVSFSCADALAGVAMSDVAGDNQTLTGEGAGQTVSSDGTCIDKAGNPATTPVTVGPINIDKTAPVITGDANPDANAFGWNNTDVTVSFSCTDGLSGVFSNTIAGATLTGEGAGQSVTNSGSCVDAAGNAAGSATVSGINIDKTAPTMGGSRTPAANSYGWNNTNVTANFTCSDGLSGVDTFSPTSTVLSSEGAGQSASSNCADKAGNGSSVTVSGINIDKSAPTAVAFGAHGLTEGMSYYFGFVPAGPTTCTANYDISGPVGCVVSGYSGAVGPHTVQAAATDKAGNVGNAFIHYTVLGWNLTGFYQPVDMNGIVNTVKAGSTVPLKFEVFAGPMELTSVTFIEADFRVVTLNCANLSGASLDEIELTTTGGTSFRYDTTGGQFIQNWKTPAGAGKCYGVSVELADGSTKTALFKTK